MSTSTPLVVGTRGSPLALQQTREVLALLEAASPRCSLTVKTIRTQGDRDRQTPLDSLGRGVFVKELEDALLAGQIDLAVHSLKDLPSRLPRGLAIGAVATRADPRDALVSRLGLTLARFPKGAVIGTSSPRRAAQLKAFRPDLVIMPLRGNVDTRLRKALDSQYDGIVLAAAGLQRLGLADRITEYLDPDVCLPEAGQGALAIEVRAEDKGVQRLVAPVNHLPTWQAVTAERAFLEALGGGCKVPITAYGVVKDGILELVGLVAQPDGSRILRTRVAGDPAHPEDLGSLLGRRLIDAGARELLDGAVA